MRAKRVWEIGCENVSRVWVDKNATFRGRDAIRAYWETQICGKQSNIRFRHVESEMVLDAEVRRQHPSDDD